jgi:hypothetical protein
MTKERLTKPSCGYCLPTPVRCWHPPLYGCSNHIAQLNPLQSRIGKEGDLLVRHGAVGVTETMKIHHAAISSPGTCTGNVSSQIYDNVHGTAWTLQ